MKNDLVVEKAKKIIRECHLNSFYSVEKYYFSSNDCYTESQLKKTILKSAQNEYEQNYLFVGKVIKQIKLLLI